MPTSPRGRSRHSIMHSLNHSFVETNGILLHLVQAGPVDGPLVILLHGFPEFWYGWRHQITALAAAGYRVWAPDQRGYNTSDKPAGLVAYGIDELVADVVGLIDAAGEERAFLVGHDWGAAVAWSVAARYPQRLNRLVILNVPHPAVMSQFIKQRPRQLLKSWYILFFQIPVLPEWILRARNWRLLTRTLVKTSRTGTFSESDLGNYRAAWSEVGPTGHPAIRTMINWYRAVRIRSIMAIEKRIIVPTLIIWGARDAFLLSDMAHASLKMCDNGQLLFIDEATHWVQHEEADRVNGALLTFLVTLRP